MSNDLVFPSVAVGWRAWIVSEGSYGIRLRSVAYDAVWEPREEFRATCSVKRGHNPPGESCRCGVYAARDLEHLRGLGYQDTGVIGTVGLWGEVVEGTMGFRASVAYPSRLFVAHYHWRWAKPLRETYGVPVKLANPFEGEVS